MSVLSENMTEPQIQKDRANSRGKKILRRLAAAAIVLASLLVISVTGDPASKDYISCWSAGKLLIHHAHEANLSL